MREVYRTIVYSDGDAANAVQTLLKADLISNDIETVPFQKKKSKHPFAMTINCYSGLIGDKIYSYCFPFQRSKSLTSGAPSNLETMYRSCYILNQSGIRFTGQNYVYDLMWLLRYGLPVKNYAYDTMGMFWSLWPELPKTLDFISSILNDNYQYWKAGRKSQDFEEYCEYGMNDTLETLVNTLKLVDMLSENPAARRNFAHAHLRCIAGLTMSAAGMKVNTDTLKSYETTLQGIANQKLERLRYLTADPVFNPNSPKQKSELIYSILGARKRNSRGRFVNKIEEASTGAVVLRSMRNDHPIFRRIANGILEAIEPAKQLSNVVGMSQFPIRDNRGFRFLTAYDGVGTTTTRLASRGSAFGHGGNAQNIRKDYRTFLEADSDSFLLDIDFSGADEVFVTFESRDPKKMELIRSGKDIHASNALIFFTNWTYDQIIAGKKAHDPRVVHPITGIRQITKKLVHGNNYLMAGLTLLMTAGREAIVAAAQELGFADAGYWSQEKLVGFCSELEKKFRAHYTRLKRSGQDSWYSEVRKELIDNKGFLTCFNYFQRFLGDPAEDEVLRAAVATAGQAGTAGRINMVMEELLFGIRTTRFRDAVASDSMDQPRTIDPIENGCSLRLQTHDSLTFNIRYTHPNWQDGVRNIYHVMNRPVIVKGEEFRVGIEAEVSYRWAGKEGITLNNAKFLEDIDRFLKLKRADVPRFDAVLKAYAERKEKIDFDGVLAEIYPNG